MMMWIWECPSLGRDNTSLEQPLEQPLDFSSLFLQAASYVSTLLQVNETKIKIFMSRSKGPLSPRTMGEDEKTPGILFSR